MTPKKKIEIPKEELEIKEVIEAPKEEPRDFPVIIKETNQIKVIKKSEYNDLIHTAI